MDAISNYDPELIMKLYLNNLKPHTSRSIRQRLDIVQTKIRRLELSAERYPVALGENCGVRAKLRDIGESAIGSNFFDNIVIKIDDVAKLVRDDFSNILCLANLGIGEWERHDSVYDALHHIFYHHYFCPALLAQQKGRNDSGNWRRIIDETDIPLFLAAVRSRFEYFAEKFRIIARSKVKKIYILRKVTGAIVTAEEYDNLYDSLKEFGAINFELLIVHSHGEPDKAIASTHYVIPEPPEDRWGRSEDWRSLARTWR